MIVVSYKRDRLVSQAIGIVFLAIGAGWLALQDGFGLSWRLFGGLLAISLPFVSLALARRAIDGVQAIRETAVGIELSSLYGSRSVAWKNLIAIEREVLQQSSGFGLIKQDVAHYIVFVGYEIGEGEFRFKIQEDLLDWPEAGLNRLFELLTAAWQDKVAATKPLAALRPVNSNFVAKPFGRRVT